MEKIIAATFDIADQKCKMYNALEWHNFIADTREKAQAATRPAAGTLEELFDEVYGDEFWFELLAGAYSVAFDLRSEEFVLCQSDTDIEFIMEMARDSGDEEEIFWAE